LLTIPVAPMITGMTKHFMFHILWISILRFLYFNFFSASLLLLFILHHSPVWLMSTWCIKHLKITILKVTTGAWSNCVLCIEFCLAKAWVTGRSKFDFRQRREDFFSHLCVQTGSEAHPASWPMGTRGPFLGIKRGQGVTLTTHPHLVPSSRMNRSYISSPHKRLRGV
jgi:hypothetical protein